MLEAYATIGWSYISSISLPFHAYIKQLSSKATSLAPREDFLITFVNPYEA